MYSVKTLNRADRGKRIVVYHTDGSDVVITIDKDDNVIEIRQKHYGEILNLNEYTVNGCKYTCTDIFTAF
jgi:hypothetical protein